MIFSVDLRERVVLAVERGMRINEAAKFFNISIKTIYRWLSLQKQMNNLQPKFGYQKGHSHKIKNWDEFKKFADQHRHSTIGEMASAWQEQYQFYVSKSTINRALKKINYTSKKKRFNIPKRTKRKENNF